jgi:hypothetical protein
MIIIIGGDTDPTGLAVAETGFFRSKTSWISTTVFYTGFLGSGWC